MAATDEERREAAAAPSRTSTRPAPPVFEAIPAALRDRPAWLLWKRERRGDLVTKVPYYVETTDEGPRLRGASTTDPATWSDFETARDAYTKWYDHGIDGIGYVFSDGDPFVGIDVDHIRDPETGELDPRVIDQALGFGSYAEYSQSGDGVHVIAIGRKPGADCRKGDAEMYATGRYFVMTGRHIDGTPDDVTEANPGALEAFYGSIARETRREVSPAPKAPAAAPAMADDEIIERARDANNGAKFSALFDAGSTAGYPSHSEADAALCALLAFWTRDAYQIDRLFRRSGLMRDKWTEKHGKTTYGETTIESAIRLGGETYTPPAPTRGRPPKAASSTAAGPTRPSPAPPAAEALPDELERFVYPLRSGALRVDDAIVGEYLYEKYHVISFNGVLYIYEAGMYRKNKGTLEAEIKRIVQGTGTHEQLTRVTREVLAHIAATAPFDTFPFNQAGDLIPVRNGVISIDYESETVALLPHDPKYRFLYQIPTVYDPEADRAPMRAVLGEYVEEEALDVLYEIPAVALLQMHGQQPYKRSYIVQGPANSAKSTYLLLLTELIGEDNVSSVSLQTITNDRFAFSDMESKILNIHDELKDIPLRDIGQFKKITGSYKHRIERKHETAYDGRITCPLVFSCNTPPSYPESEEFEDAWWIRWEYLNFVNVFPVDPTFRERVITPAVMSGFLNGVIDAMIYIHKHGLYREPDPGRVKESWKLASDLFKEFVAAEMVPVSGALENFKKGTLFAGFIQWCRDENKPTNRIPTDFKTFSPMVFRNEFVPRQIGPKTNREHVYAGPYKFKEGSKYAQPF